MLVDASVDGQKVWVILDTGAQTTVANNVLRRKLEEKGRLRTTVPIMLQSVTGGQMAADQTTVKRIRLGGMDIRDMPVAFADVHPFAKLGLSKKPALLLGMDALRLFDRVSVDFPNRRVRLLGGSRSERQGTKFASERLNSSPGICEAFAQPLRSARWQSPSPSGEGLGWGMWVRMFADAGEASKPPPPQPLP
jgi:hypothetical protein